jgi:3-phosphoshikimate 1-carboxyvinyltransferase
MSTKMPWKRGVRKSSGPPLRGEVRVGGDKSISHRCLLVAALASGRSTVRGLNVGADVMATARAVSGLGAPCAVDPDNYKALVEGSGWPGLYEPHGVLDAGNSGTTIRTLLGVCAGVEGVSVLTGDDSLRRRPMLRVVSPLRQMGASIDGRDHGRFPPLCVRGGELQGIDVELPVASAQVKTALLLAGLRAVGTTSVTEPHPSRDHTERMLEAAGVAVARHGAAVSVEGGSEVAARSWSVPGDLSSAFFLLVAAAVVPGSDLTVAGVGLNPTRTGALQVLRRMGASVDVEVTGEDGGEPAGRVRVGASSLRGVTVDAGTAPGLLDEVPALAVAATQAEGVTEIRGAGELRVKESDRIRALVEGLRALGADAEELRDGLAVRGPAALDGGVVSSHGDHRIAMSFAVAGLVSATRVRVDGWSCVDTSFPDFLDVLGEAQGKRR